MQTSSRTFGCSSLLVLVGFYIELAEMRGCIPGLVQHHVPRWVTVTLEMGGKKGVQTEV